MNETDDIRPDWSRGKWISWSTQCLHYIPHNGESGEAQKHGRCNSVSQCTNMKGNYSDKTNCCIRTHCCNTFVVNLALTTSTLLLHSCLCVISQYQYLSLPRLALPRHVCTRRFLNIKCISTKPRRQSYGINTEVNNECVDDSGYFTETMQSILCIHHISNEEWGCALQEACESQVSVPNEYSPCRRTLLPVGPCH